MDGTGGSWSACVADDGTFDEASETFTCTVGSALSDGAHTMYVRATDIVGNTTAGGSESTDAFTIDATIPSVSLTAIAPDPGSDTTPTIAGTATDSGGTISTVEYQVDSTSGSWTACTATDGTFDEASEAFTCTVGTVLSDGAHTIYVRATDTASNNSSNASDAYTLDTTAPSSFDLASPSDNEYLNSRRPVFRWKTSTDTSGINKYRLEINNGDLGNITIDNISPNYSNTTIEGEKYDTRYETSGEETYISVTLKGTSLWSEADNYGEVAEGKRGFSVYVEDGAGNGLTRSNNFFVDFATPSFDTLTLNGESIEDGKTYTTVSTEPQFYAKLTDKLTGDTRANSGDENQIASGPKEVQVSIDIENPFGFDLLAVYRTSFSDTYWTDTNIKITDNNKNDSDKYGLYQHTLENKLVPGTYKISVTGSDNAGNSVGRTIYLNVLGGDDVDQYIIDRVEEVEEEEELTAEEEEELKTEIREDIRDLIEDTSEYGPSRLARLTTFVSTLFANITGGTRVLIVNAQGAILRLTSAYGQVNKRIFTALSDSVSNSMAFVFGGVKSTGELVVVLVFGGVKTVGGFIADTSGDVYYFLKAKSPGVIAGVLDNIETGINMVSDRAGRSYLAVATVVGNTASDVGSAAGQAGNWLSDIGQSTSTSAGNVVQDSLAYVDGKTARTRGRVARVYESIFDSEPTEIQNVQIVEIGSDYALVTWETNHHTVNNKVNFGTDLSYGQEAWGEDYTKEHVVRLEDLEPDEEYVFEVMGRNSNYIYDAWYSFKTEKL